MMRQKLSEIKKSYKDIGFNESTEKPRLKGIVYCIVLPFLAVNEIAFISYNWANVRNRVNGLKAMYQFTICATYLMMIVFFWKHTKLLLKIIDEGPYKFPFRSTNKRHGLQLTIQNNAKTQNNVWYYILMSYFVGEALKSLLLFLLTVAQQGISNIRADMLYQPFPFYYPEKYNTLFWYFVSALTQLFFLMEWNKNTQITGVASCICMELISGDLKLLGLSLEEMDSLINDCTINVERSGLCATKDDAQTTGMKTFLRYFVTHHNDIHRKVTEATKAMKYLGLCLDSGMSVFICMTIYGFVKENVLAFKLQECIYCCVGIYFQYHLDTMGESVSKEDNNIRQGLYDSRWIDKPMWFKRSLQIIMTRMNKTLEIQSNGMFALNMRSFLVTLKAAYSAYNMLINVNN